MKQRTAITILITALLTTLVCTTVYALVDSLTPAADPESTTSYTLADIYQRLVDGTAGSQSTFTEPATGPGGTMQTLNDIMDQAPALDETNGATAADVTDGKTFWGLTGDEWGLQTGTSAASAACDPDVTACAPVAFDYPLVSKTGQTTCYSETGSEIACTGTGQDGDYQRGVDPALSPSRGTTGAYNTPAWTGVRFTDNGDGTVTDNVTGLIWLKNANCFNLRRWAQALSNANSLESGSCGLTDGSSTGDWRLPNVNELHSLIDLTEFNPALPSGHPFTSVLSEYYWSSTSHSNGSGAWRVDLVNGEVGNTNKTGDRYVWPVRDGQD